MGGIWSRLERMWANLYQFQLCHNSWRAVSSKYIQVLLIFCNLQISEIFPTSHWCWLLDSLLMSTVVLWKTSSIAQAARPSPAMQRQLGELHVRWSWWFRNGTEEKCGPVPPPSLLEPGLPELPLSGPGPYGQNLKRGQMTNLQVWCRFGLSIACFSLASKDYCIQYTEINLKCW